jgi:hypothetical protein
MRGNPREAQRNLTERRRERFGSFFSLRRSSRNGEKTAKEDFMLLFVMAYHNDKELETFQIILDNWEKLLEMKMRFKFLFVESVGRRISTHYDHVFLRYDDSHLTETNSQMRVSLEWSLVARYIEKHIDCSYWFWWEPDVLPVRRDCFEKFMSLSHDRCQIMGYRVRDNLWGMRNKIGGVALYVKDYWSYMQPFFDLNGTFDTRRTFERKKDGGVFVELNKWYALVHHEGRLRLTPGLRLVHGIKNNSLLNQIIHGETNYPVVSDFRRAAMNKWKVTKSNVRETVKEWPVINRVREKLLTSFTRPS